MESENSKTGPKGPIPRYVHSKVGTVSALEKSQTPVPLRLLIDKGLIGPVMGPGKATVKQISNETKTRIFYDGKLKGKNENVSEIGLAIFGKPYDCSYVCRKILEIMRIQQNKLRLNDNRSVSLKILMPRCYIGRIIGRSFNVMKTIMSKSETKIILSDIYDKSIPHERIIIIEGSIENMCKAEVEISKILRQSFTNDPHSMAPQYFINPGVLMMEPTYVSYPKDVFQISHQTFPPVQYLPLYSNNNHQFLPPIIQPQTIINPEFHMVEPTNTIYTDNVFQINQQPFSPVQFLPSYTEGTDLFLNTNVYSDQAQTTINPEFHMMDTTNINHSAPVFQINHQPCPPAQYLPSYSNITDSLLAFNRNDAMESVYLFIPVFTIKSLVGIKCSNINYMTRISGANIHILPKVVENPIAPHQFCYKMKVIGTCEGQWKAQEMIFDSMWKEGYGPAPEEVILTIEISVPHYQAQCIIDNNRSLTREMGCIIKLSTNQTTDNTACSSLLIIGGFIGTQLAQKRIRSILQNQDNHNPFHINNNFDCP